MVAYEGLYEYKSLPPFTVTNRVGIMLTLFWEVVIFKKKENKY